VRRFYGEEIGLEVVLGTDEFVTSPWSWDTTLLRSGLLNWE
jgi:hypothetical protein